MYLTPLMSVEKPTNERCLLYLLHRQTREFFVTLSTRGDCLPNISNMPIKSTQQQNAPIRKVNPAIDIQQKYHEGNKLT